MSKKPKSINTLILEKTIELLELTRLEAAVFYRLLGFLLRNDDPFPYSAEKLAQKTLYKEWSIFKALKSLEEKKLITRIGFSYQRRFYKGSSLVEICTQLCLSHGIELNTPVKNTQYPVLSTQYPVKTTYNKTSLKLGKHTQTVVQKLQNQTPKTKTPWPELSEEDRELIGAYKHGLKYPEFQLSGLKLQRAEIIYKRLN